MQDNTVLAELGFRPNEFGEMVYQGKSRVFLAQVVDCNGPVYVQLFALSDKIDMRKDSPHKGRPLNERIKDCCSVGSVKRAIEQFDKPRKTDKRF